MGGRELAVDGVVIVGGTGNYPTDLKGTGFCRAGGCTTRLSGFRAEQTLGAGRYDKHLASFGTMPVDVRQIRELGFPLYGVLIRHTPQARD